MLHIWDELATVTAALEKLRSDRKIAHRAHDRRLKDQIHIKFDELLERRDRLISKIAENSAQAVFE
jgi:hypothetical protein